MKQRLEPVVVHDAAAAADVRRDGVGALVDPAGRFGIDRGTVGRKIRFSPTCIPSSRVAKPHYLLLKAGSISAHVSPRPHAGSFQPNQTQCSGSRDERLRYFRKDTRPFGMANGGPKTRPSREQIANHDE